MIAIGALRRAPRRSNACMVPQPVEGQPGLFTVDATWGTISPMQIAPGRHIEAPGTAPSLLDQAFAQSRSWQKPHEVRRRRAKGRIEAPGEQAVVLGARAGQDIEHERVASPVEHGKERRSFEFEAIEEEIEQSSRLCCVHVDILIQYVVRPQEEPESGPP